MFERIEKDGQEIVIVKMTNEIIVDKDFDGKELGDNELIMIGSTAGIDRDGESIDPTAWDLKQFKKNPVILPQHDYRKPAIGKAKDVKMVDGKLTFKIEFPEDGVNPEADIYRKLYKSGFMNASSVGFIGKEWVDGDGKKSPFRKFTKVELLELSLVSIPANPEAITQAKAFLSEAEVKFLEGEKSSDPNLILNDEHVKQHSVIMAFIEEAKAKFAFIEGFITGMTKSQDENESYVKSLLCGVPMPKSNEQASTDEVGLKALLLEKSLKQILKE